MFELPTETHEEPKNLVACGVGFLNYPSIITHMLPGGSQAEKKCIWSSFEW